MGESAHDVAVKITEEKSAIAKETKNADFLIIFTPILL
jgi:hypothetical protein